MRSLPLLVLVLAVTAVPAAAQPRRLSDTDLPTVQRIIAGLVDRAKLQKLKFDQSSGQNSRRSYWVNTGKQWESASTDPLAAFRKMFPQLRVPPGVTYDPVCSRDRSLTSMGMLGNSPTVYFSMGEGTALMEQIRTGDSAGINRSTQGVRSPLEALATVSQLFTITPQMQASLDRVAAFYRGVPGLEVIKEKGTHFAARSQRASGDSLGVIVISRNSMISDYQSSCEETLPAGLVLVFMIMPPEEMDTEAPLNRAMAELKRAGKNTDGLLSTIYQTCRDAQPDGFIWLKRSLEEETGSELAEARARLANVQWYRRHEADLGPKMRAISAANDGDDPCG